MQQRRLRLGDSVDDYCPRERRITNHAVVALVSAEIKQPRCTTCEAEHEYKAAKAPRQRRPTTLAATTPVVNSNKGKVPAEPKPNSAAVLDVPPGVDGSLVAPEPATERNDGSVRRPLIRATLPRLEGQVPERRMPEFTVRQSNGRNGNGREGNGRVPSGKRHSSNGGRAAGGGFARRSREQGRSQARAESGNRRQGRSSERLRSRSSRPAPRGKKSS